MIVRTYQCLDCGDTFEVSLDSGNAADPPCPYCEKVLEWRPGMFSIGTHKGKAVDVAQQVLEQDYGLTNFRDGSREGDVTAMPPPAETTSERETRMRSEIESNAALAELAVAATPEVRANTAKFFGGFGATAQIGANQVSAQTMLAAARSGPGADTNPMELLHKAGKAGKLPTNYRIIARSNG